MARKRGNSLGVWLTDTELAKVKAAASEANLSPSVFIRKCLLQKEVTIIPGIRDLTVELKRIGNNLNQITRAVNEGSVKIPGDDLITIKDELGQVWALLCRIFKKI